MDSSAHRSATEVPRRIVARTARYLRRDPIVLLSLAALVALLALGLPQALTSAAASPTGQDGAAQYMRALHERNADLFYESLGPAMRRQLESGVGLQGSAAAAALLRFQEQSGDRILEYRLIGRHETNQGGSLHFYVARARSGNEQVEVPYVITLDRNGKVVEID